MVNASKISTSLMTCGTASGELLPFYVKYKAGRVWDTWTERGPPGTKYDCSKSGWFDNLTFQNWFFRIFLPNAKNKLGPKVLICDNLSSHLDRKVLDKCKEHNIKFVFLPPNTTHLTQPLDVAFFAPMKRCWRSLLGEWKCTTMGQKCTTLPKSEFPRMLAQLWTKITLNSANNLMAGFRKCGITPCDADVLLSRLPKKDRVNLQSIGTGFINFVEKRHQDVVTCITPRRREATNIVAG